jgi:anti-sigma factor RsiW
MPGKHRQADLIPFVRGELDAREHARTAAHLDGCADCRAHAAALTRTLGLIAREIEQLPTPEWTQFRAELRRRLAAREAPAGRWWQPVLVWGSFAAAGVAAVAFASIVLLRRGPDSLVPLVSPEQLAFEDVISRTDVGLLRNYPMVERLDMLENDSYEVIEHLDELAPARSHRNEIRHL